MKIMKKYRKELISKNEKLYFQEYEFTVDETVDVGTMIGSIGITDGDGTDSVRISIRDIDIQQYFRITPNGEILTNKKLDFEKNSQ